MADATLQAILSQYQNQPNMWAQMNRGIQQYQMPASAYGAKGSPIVAALQGLASGYTGSRAQAQEQQNQAGLQQALQQYEAQQRQQKQADWKAQQEFLTGQRVSQANQIAKTQQEMEQANFPQKLKQEGQLAGARAAAKAKYTKAGTQYSPSDEFASVMAKKLVKRGSFADEETAFNAVKKDFKGFESLQKERRLDLAQQQQEGVSSRFQDKLSRSDAERVIPGYTVESGRLTSEQAGKIKEQNKDTEKLINTLYEISGRDLSKYMGEGSSMNQALAGQAFNIWRIATGSGARLEGIEGTIIENMTPAAMAHDPVRAIGEWLKGRDQNTFAVELAKFVEKEHDASLLAYGIKKQGVSDDYYSNRMKTRYPELFPNAKKDREQATITPLSSEPNPTNYKSLDEYQAELLKWHQQNKK